MHSRKGQRDGFTFTHAKGCELTGDVTTGFEEALRNAQTADIIIAVVGEKWNMSGEAKARADISLPGMQEQLIKELVATGKPVVVVLMNGRPLTIPWIAEHATAVVEAWLPGTMGGPAVADVLFGDYNPSAKLTMTFPRHVGQVPIFYNEKNTGRPFDPNNGYTSRYLDMPNTPQYPFGFGLSYTTFTYDSMLVARKDYSFNDTIIATVNIKIPGLLRERRSYSCMYATW